MPNITPAVRLISGAVAGIVTVILIDRFLLPGTLRDGLIGVAAAVGVLTAMSKPKNG